MRYVTTAALVSPIWAFVLSLFASQTNAKLFSQEWLDLAALFCVYTLAASVVGIILVRLLMWMSAQNYYRHG